MELFSPDPASNPSSTSPSKGESHSDAWTRICGLLKARIGAGNFERWFDGVRFEMLADHVRLVVASPISLVWIESNYASLVADTVAEVLGKAIRVDLATDDHSGSGFESAELKAAKLSSPAPRTTRTREPAQGRFVSQSASPSPRSLTDAGLNSKFTFEGYVVGPNNSYSTAVARAVAEQPGSIYNPLFFHGGSGLGKTHLMQAIAHEVLTRRPRSSVRYVTSEQFTNEFIDAVRKNDFNDFRRRYRRVDVLIIDDIHFLASKDSTQEEFFHTFNELFNSGRQIILASDRPPGEIKNLESRLVSRFEWGLTSQVQVPDYETRVAILRRKQADYQVNIEPWIPEFIAKRIKTNVRKLEGALMRVAAHLSLASTLETESELDRLLADVLDQEPAKSITVDRVQRVVASHFDLRISDLIGPRRTKNLAWGRQVAMYLVRTLVKMPLIQIGEEFGGRDHGTVIHACRQVEKRLASDPEARPLIDALTSRILED
ncbi:MAG: chromosomal replication initiator protein DnaA [Verrucomicrobiales bacterium]|nr:chromosomal replication initiator protein DnaA [Verrucomicrobiales bacterium]